MRLTEREYWERTHAGAHAPVPSDRLRGLLGERLWRWTQPYDDYLLWEVILPRYLAGARGWKAIEIGSAPGRFMVKLADTFGVEPHGVEYTAAGAAANREVFAAAGYDPSGVIEADALSPEFQSRHAGKFDLVVSRGFIEHFTDPAPVIEGHLALLRPGGLLLVMIPNLRGVYGAWTRLFNRPQIPLHNVEIMRLDRFHALFDPRRIEPLHYRHHGTFSFWLFTAKPPARVMRHVLRGLVLAQRGMNVLMRAAFGARGCESAWFSPALLFIGRKAGP